jgi:hypothetical protein
MSDQSKKLQQKTLFSSEECICSGELQAGKRPSTEQAGQEKDLFGPSPVHVNLILQRANKKRKKTIATSGQKQCGSSASASLAQLLASRSRERLGSAGSIEYSWDWNGKVTLAGRWYCLLRACPRHTSEAESGGSLFDQVQENKCLGDSATAGWPTPNAPNVPNGGCSPAEGTMTSTGQTEDGKRQVDLQQVARLTGWPTCQAGDAKNSRNATSARREGSQHHDGQTLCDVVTGWTTPQTDDRPSKNHDRSLAIESQMAGWPTPVANDDQKTPEAHLAMKLRMGERDGTGAQRTAITSLNVMAHTIQVQPGPIMSSSNVPTAKTGVLNPALPRWLMQYPRSWDRYSPGYNEWAILQAILGESSEVPSETGQEGSVPTETA